MTSRLMSRRMMGMGRTRGEAEESPSDEGAMRARGGEEVALQGVQRLSAREVALSGKECGGSGICEHGRAALSVTIKEWRGLNLRARSCSEYGSQCKECGGGSNLRARSSALSVQGVRWVSICEHGRQRALGLKSACKECGGSESASTVLCSSYCKECGGSGICEHGRTLTVQGVCGDQYESGPAVYLRARSCTLSTRWGQSE